MAQNTKNPALLKKLKEKHEIIAFFHQNTCTIQKKAVPLHRNSEEKPSIKDVSWKISCKAYREICGNSSVGRAQPCQGWGREFEPRFPLYACPSGGIGRRARFRCVCREACRFDSCLGHKCIATKWRGGGMVDALLWGGSAARRGSSSLLLFTFNAEIAQLVEHNLAKVGVASSSLVFRSMFAQVAELVDAHVSGACVERRAGSTPVLGTKFRSPVFNWISDFFFIIISKHCQSSHIQYNILFLSTIPLYSYICTWHFNPPCV